MTSNSLVYLDTETTGLNPDLHEVWEIAFAIDDGPIIHGTLSHSLRTADPLALELNHYDRRVHNRVELRDHSLQDIFKKNTLVCANPTFDRMMMRARWGVEPWHYRSIDIEAVAMTVFGWDRPKGMKDIRDELVRQGFEIPAPDHSARMDVMALRDCYVILRDIQNKYIKAYGRD